MAGKQNKKSGKDSDGGNGSSQKGSSKVTPTGAALGAAAVGLAAGLAANLGRKALIQGVTAASGNWADALATEHKLTLKVFDALQKTDDSQKKKRSTLLMQLKHALMKHAVQEENVIYPAMREAGQQPQADELNHEHGYVKQALYDLEVMAKDSSRFLPAVAKFRAEIEEHMRDEEDRQFPALFAKLDEAANKKLTAMMNKEGFKVA